LPAVGDLCRIEAFWILLALNSGASVWCNLMALSLGVSMSLGFFILILGVRRRAFGA
jgi:hypothetical protein